MKCNLVIAGGCGHVGLPLGLVFADRGADVTLLDIDSKKVDCVNSGRMPFWEKDADALLRRRVGINLRASLNAECLRAADAVITVVGTPVDKHLNPTVSELYHNIDQLLSRMREGSALLLRSTVYPGVTRLVYERTRKLRRQIHVAFCPERIAEGNAMRELVEFPQIISAFTPEAMSRARTVFLAIAPKVIELEPLEAELCKLFTNSWRYLNFAISNQFYTLAESYGLDFYRIYDAVTRDYPRMQSFSRPGFAAGPCLVKDTLQLSTFANNNFFLGHAAMLVNEGLPNFVVERLRRGRLAEQRVAILGMAFKSDSDDPRESLSYKLRNLLSVYAKEVLCTDPYIADPSFVPLETALEHADILILAAPHSVYRQIHIAPGKEVIDIWNFWERSHEQEEPAAAALMARAG